MELDIDKLKEVIVDVNKKLDKHNKESNWEERYYEYSKKLLNYESNKKELGKKFRKWKPFGYYLNVGNAKKGKDSLNISMRYLGQIIADITVQNGDVFISTNKYDSTNRKYFDCPDNMSVNGKWDSVEAQKFRKFFKDRIYLKKNNQEHRLESELLAEFSKNKSKDKILCNIQPVKFAGFRFPMLSEISASDHNNIHTNITNIDIFARTNKKLTVFELKDEYKSSEGPQKVLEQATAYATFILKLLRSKAGENWYKIMGYSKTEQLEKPITIKVCLAMPCNENQIVFEPFSLKFGKDILEYHYFYFKENNNKFEYFDTNLFDKVK